MPLASAARGQGSAARRTPIFAFAQPRLPSHVSIRVRFHAYAFGETPSPDATGKRELPPGTLVRVAEFLGDWVIVARDEEKMG